MDNNDLAFALGSFLEAEKQGAEIAKPQRESAWLFDFAHDIIGMNDVNFDVGIQPETHTELCCILEDVVGDCRFAGSTQKLVLIELPRGTYKTSIACEALPIGITVRNPNVRGLIVNAEHESSKKRIKAVKFHYTRTPEFVDKYGDDWKPAFQTDAWSSTQITVSKRTKALREPTIDTASVGKDMTGSHYDFIIADDLVNRKNVKTPEMRTDVYEYLMSLLAILDPGGTLIVIGTRWHADDAYGRIIKEDEKRERDGKKPNFFKYIKSCWDGPGGLFFPKKQTYEFLQEQLARVKSRFFAANYENKPVADEDRLFKMHLAQVKEFEFLKSGTQGWVQTREGRFAVDTSIAWDPAGRTPNRKSDSHGITVVGDDTFDRWWVFAAEGYKGMPSAVIDRMCNYISYYRPRKLIIESVGGYGLWIDLLQAELIKRGLSVAIVEDTVGGQSKATRIAMLEPRWENRAIFLKPDQETLYEQIQDFSPDTEMVHEDVLDSLAKHVGNAHPAKEASFRIDNPFDPEWQAHKREMRAEQGGSMGAGRSRTRWGR